MLSLGLVGQIATLFAGKTIMQAVDHKALASSILNHENASVFIDVLADAILDSTTSDSISSNINTFRPLIGRGLQMVRDAEGNIDAQTIVNLLSSPPPALPVQDKNVVDINGDGPIGSSTILA